MKGWEVGKEKEKVTSSSAGIVGERISGRKVLPKHFLKGNLESWEFTGHFLHKTIHTSERQFVKISHVFQKMQIGSLGG